MGPWGFGVGGFTPPSAYLVVCAKLRPFGAFQFLPKVPLTLLRFVLLAARLGGGGDADGDVPLCRVSYACLGSVKF